MSAQKLVALKEEIRRQQPSFNTKPLDNLTSKIRSHDEELSSEKRNYNYNNETAENFKLITKNLASTFGKESNIIKTMNTIQNSATGIKRINSNASNAGNSGNAGKTRKRNRSNSNAGNNGNAGNSNSNSNAKRARPNANASNSENSENYNYRMAREEDDKFRSDHWTGKKLVAEGYGVWRGGARRSKRRSTRRSSRSRKNTRK